MLSIGPAFDRPERKVAEMSTDIGINQQPSP
jgi:hypothetical protein